MDDARDLIRNALEQATEITQAGSSSVLAIAARALDPATPITREGLCESLGLHASLVIATLVAADLASDSEARRQLGLQLFGRLKLRGHPPELSSQGQMSICVYCLEQLATVQPLDGLVEEVRKLAETARDGGTLEPAELRIGEARALEIQQTRVVPLDKGSRTRLGIPEEEAARRRAAQAVRAVLRGLQEPTPSDHLTPTVAGEVAGTICLLRQVDAAATFVLGLAEQLEAMPPEEAARPAGN